MEEKNLTNEQGLAASAADLVEEASALNEMSNKVRNLEAQNAELMAAKKKYYDTILNGGTVEEVAPYRTRDEIRKELFSIEDKDNMTNLDYAKLAVELDDACIREQGESCFLPKGKGVTPTVDERDVAVRMNAVLKECIEEADGDPHIFDQALQRRIRK